jgi:hypothetical protein
MRWLGGAVPGLVAGVLTTLCLATPASAATFCVQKICGGTFENSLSEALSDAAANGERDRIELGAYIDTIPAVDQAGSAVDIVGSGDSSVLQGGGGNVARLKIRDPTSTVSNLQVRLNADSSTGIETNGVIRNVNVTADPPADQTLVGVLMTGTSTLDGAGIFLPTTPNMDTTGVRTEGVGVKTLNNVAAEGETGILVFNTPPFGPNNNTIVRAAFVRASSGINANQSQVLVDDALVEAASRGLTAFTDTGSAALRARHVTVVGSGSANSTGISSADVDGTGPLTSTVDVSDSIVTGFDRDLSRPGGGALDVNWSRYATTGTTPPTGANNTPAPPAFVNPGARDFRLTAGSAMIDAGDPAALASDERVTDLDGLARLVNGDGDGDCTARRDLGAFEYHPGQRAPIAASATAAPGSVAAGQPTTFSVSACDPDGDALTFSWSFDDGTNAGGAQVSKAFATGGTHRGTVTVSDPGGRTVTAAASVVVAPPPPLSILSFSMLRQTFAVGSARTPVSAAAKPKRGSAFRYRLSKAGNVSITIHALLSGRILKGRCVKPTRKLRSAKKCTRAVKRGTLRRAAMAGANNVPFSGRIGTKPLAPGSYRATIAAPRATSRTARFTIVGGS